jgi:hypothetical protein
MTAAEAAERAHAELARGAGGDAGRLRQTASAGESEEGPCTQDADCTYTRVAAGACCPMLCVPRVVTKKRAAELEENIATCSKALGGGCPLPMCRPPSPTIPVCEAGRCVAKPAPGGMRD